ncbi:MULTISPECIES: hypothetical protein [Bacillaceae]|uniref:Flagellar biosynthesis protein FlhB n=1 Tax=Peribacillus huizhouensis TaxID=1501239 RepID=A0ABR6CN21_9BACI|nr:MULTISPECIES: hypothetical protein [Bacillaceae]MBA9025782.1 flagellar biosynthesis protein FlhB [Peribacillus huizhouensis]
MILLKGMVTIFIVTWFISSMIVAIYDYQRKEPPKIIKTYSTIGFWAMILGIAAFIWLV